MTDSGLLHALLGIDTPQALERHPKLGASWEGFILTQVVHITWSQTERVSFLGHARRCRVGSFSRKGQPPVRLRNKAHRHPNSHGIHEQCIGDPRVEEANHHPRGS